MAVCGGNVRHGDVCGFLGCGRGGHVKAVDNCLVHFVAVTAEDDIFVFAEEGAEAASAFCGGAWSVKFAIGVDGCWSNSVRGCSRRGDTVGKVSCAKC